MSELDLRAHDVHINGSCFLYSINKEIGVIAGLHHITESDLIKAEDAFRNSDNKYKVLIATTRLIDQRKSLNLMLSRNWKVISTFKNWSSGATISLIALVLVEDSTYLPFRVNINSQETSYFPGCCGVAILGQAKLTEALQYFLEYGYSSFLTTSDDAPPSGLNPSQIHKNLWFVCRYPKTDEQALPSK